MYRCRMCRDRYNYADMCTCAFEQRPKLLKSKLDMGWHNRGCRKQKRGVRKLP